MNEPISVARDYIFNLYRRFLGQEIEALSQFPEDLVSPVWMSIDSNFDLVSETDAHAGSLLLDPELGTCLFLQTFESQMDIRPQITRALRMQSRLRPRQISRELGADQYGEWRIVLHWLVDKERFSKWEAQVSDLRRETAHFEEIPVDAVVNWDDDWESACKAHSFPRLLIRTREAIRKSSEVEALSWISADEKIAEQVRDLPNKAESEIERQKALELIELLESVEASNATEGDESEAPKPLDQIRIQNFRNIRDLEMNFNKDAKGVGCHVIQGPNGSGKSSIFEAISLGSSNVSGRFVDFFEDGNVSARAKDDEYVSKYLTSLSGNSKRPMIGLNGAEPVEVALSTENTPKETVRGVSGTLLSQSINDDLLRSGAKRLGALVAGDYSKISEKVLSYISENQSLSEARRQSINQRWSMRRNVSKIETAKERITELVLESKLPTDEALTAWFESYRDPGFEGLAEFGDAKEVWEACLAHRQELARLVSRSASFIEIQSLLTSYLREYQSARDEIERLVVELKAKILNLSPDFITSFQRYGRWLQEKSVSLSDEEGLVTARRKREEAQALMLELSNTGTILSKRLEHLREAASFIEREWGVSHPDTCPTCNTNLSERSGIVSAMKQTLADTEELVLRAREDYRQARARELAALGELQRLGADEAPVDNETIQEIHQFLGTVLLFKRDPGLFTQDPESFIKQVSLDLAMSTISHLQEVPSVSELGARDTEGLVTSVIEQLGSAFAEFELASEEPEAWKLINGKFLSALTETMTEHLPETIQALWLELSRNVSSAPWQMRGDVQFALQSKRGGAEATVTVKDGGRSALAAHILNGAETQNLSVAWFFTRYLTFGRFRYAFLALDDPAHQMDQPTFRDLCRLLEGLLRIHRWHSVPVTMLVFLHQDERALDAARATNATLHLLRWNRAGPDLLKSMRMHTEDFAPRAPSLDLFAKASTFSEE